MKTLLINLIIICFYCTSLFASEIDFLGVKLYDVTSNIDEEKFAQIDNGEKCKKNHCNYKFKNKKKKVKEDGFYTNYELATNHEHHNDNKIISISAYKFDKDSLESPKNFAGWIKVHGKPMCETEMSWGIDYLTQKYNFSKKDFITTYSERKSNNPNEYSNVLFLQSKLYLDSGKKIYEIYCRYSRSDDDKWIISTQGTKLMTKDYHDAFEKNFPKNKINNFNANKIVSYLFSSSY